MKAQHHNLLNIGAKTEETAASVSTLQSRGEDEKFLHHVLKINISSEEAITDVERNLSKKVSIMIGQEQSLLRSKAFIKPFEGNLSDDQKLVLSVTESGTTCAIRNKIDLKSSNDKSEISEKCFKFNERSSDDLIMFRAISESPQPPPVPPKMKGANRQILSDSFCSDSSSASSSDSVNNGDHLVSPKLIRSIEDHHNSTKSHEIGLLPSSLLIDIRNRSLYSEVQDQLSDEQDDQESTCSDLELCNQSSIDGNVMVKFYSEDKFYKFHINENFELDAFSKMTHDESDDSFAGLKDLRSGTSTIRSKNGTIRGIKNRVRSGISTFLQMQETTVKNYKDKDGGKIIVYTTSMGIVRSTYAKCQMVKKILSTLMVKYEERDVFMSQVHQQEIRDRLQSDQIDVPQLFVNGQYIGNAEQVERYNEMGELRIMLKTFKCLDSMKTCRTCGGFNMLPCPSCGGSKKSIHRNNFTSEFVALKCMNCDEVGLVRCYSCC